jgi:hypothetical protein
MITHMQHMHFSAKSAVENPGADIYFVQPAQLAILPIHCWTVYVLAEIPAQAAQEMLRMLPSEALVVDYIQTATWERLSLHPKQVLEQQVEQQWRLTGEFLRSYDIDIAALSRDDLHSIDIMDDALDTLLSTSYKFLQVANEFQRALELARPLRISRELRNQYDTLVLLAHRVQALSPGAFTQQFLEVYNEDDTFFLYDAKRGQITLRQNAFAEAYARHVRAGRKNLALALRCTAEEHAARLHAPC